MAMMKRKCFSASSWHYHDDNDDGQDGDDGDDLDVEHHHDRDQDVEHHNPDPVDGRRLVVILSALIIAN